MRSTKLLFISVPLLATASAFGQINFNSLYSFPTSYESISANGPFFAGPLEASFSVGPSSAALGMIVLGLENPFSSSSSFTVSLETDASTAPSGTVLGSQVVDDSTVVGNPVSVDLGAMVLNANTRYWVVLSGDSSGVVWDYTNDNSGPGVSNEFWGDATGIYPNDTPFLMQVTPEPSSFAYLGLGILPFFLRRRKRA